jgi:hypothetical protein
MATASINNTGIRILTGTISATAAVAAGAMIVLASRVLGLLSM